MFCGARCHAESPVTAITPDGPRWRLTTPRGTVTADRVIVATNGYGAEDIPPWIRGRTLPAFSNVIVTRPLTETGLTRRLYAVECWLAIAGLSIYLAITEIGPRLAAQRGREA